MKIKKSSFECMRGGYRIRGKQYMPQGVSGHLPAAVVSHGFMMNHQSVEGYAKKLAEWGFVSFCFDFCGGCLNGRSDGKTTEMSVLAEKEDLLAVISYVESLPYADTSSLLLMGCSQGGFVSALAAAGLQGKVGGLVLFYPALSIPDDARAGHMILAKFDPQNVPETVKCGPMKLGRVYPESVMGMDAFAEISPYAGPVLLVHGTADSIVDVSYSKRAYEAYAGAHPQTPPEKRLVLIEGGGHGFSGAHDRQATAALERFLCDVNLMPVL